MSFWDDLGETVTGITDSVASAGQAYIDGWTSAQVDSLKTASPETQRTPVEDTAIQPNGEAVTRVTAPQDNTQKMLVYAVWGLALVGLYIALKPR